MGEVEWNSVINVVERLNETVEKLNETFDILTARINNLEVALDNLRVQYKMHDHPYKPEPRYGS